MVNATIYLLKTKIGEFNFSLLPNIGDILDFTLYEKYKVIYINWIKLSNSFYPEIHVERYYG